MTILETIRPYQEAVNLQAERIKMLEVKYAELKDQLAEVEEALVDAGMWGNVECEAQTFAEAIEMLSEMRAK